MGPSFAKEALPYAERAITLVPQQWQPYVLMGSIQVARNRNRQAHRCADQARTLGASDPDALAAVASLLASAEKNGEAKKVAQQVLANDPHDDVALEAYVRSSSNYNDTALHPGRLAHAVTVAAQAAGANPQDWRHIMDAALVRPLAITAWWVFFTIQALGRSELVYLSAVAALFPVAYLATFLLKVPATIRWRLWWMSRHGSTGLGALFTAIAISTELSLPWWPHDSRYKVISFGFLSAIAALVALSSFA